MRQGLEGRDAFPYDGIWADPCVTGELNRGPLGESHAILGPGGSLGNPLGVIGKDIQEGMNLRLRAPIFRSELEAR